MVDTLKEAEARIRVAMEPPKSKRGNGFSPSIRNMRQIAGKRKPLQIAS